MNDPLLVRCFERVGDLVRDRKRLIDRDRAVSQGASRWRVGDLQILRCPTEEE
jgi:hypothetical protein